MGGNNTKSNNIISYDDAVKRISDVELRRIKEAFRKCTGSNTTFLSKNLFVQEVLCEETPQNLADWLFQACGGTNKGINFKDLISALVLITRGSQDEKIRFLWALYSNDTNQLIIKNDFYKTLQDEAMYQSRKSKTDYQKINTLSLFGSSLTSVTFDQFRSWILMHRDATVFSKWLLVDSCVSLSSDLETPTFYQSLAGVTHLDESDICDLEKVFWQLKSFSLSGQLDIETLTHLLTPPLPKTILKGFFAAFDENCDGHIDFKELCCGISCSTRGPDVERVKFCFKILDFDRDSVLNAKEIETMISLLLTIAKDCSTSKVYKNLTYERILTDLKEYIVQSKMWCNNVDATKELTLSQEDFLMWCVQSKVNITQPFLDLLFELCHIVFGLRPQCKHLEFHIVKGWLSREVRRGYEVGQFWYLISSEWWQNWLSYTQSNNQISPCIYCKSIAHITDDNGEEVSQDERWLQSTSIESFGIGTEADSSSLGSGSSGISINRNSPGIIDNSSLLAINPFKVPSLTGEGGRLKKEVPLVQHRDFELVPEVLWKAFNSWYGSVVQLPRQVVKPSNTEDKEIELYPLNLRILRHQQPQQNVITTTPTTHPTWNNISSGYGALSNTGYSSVVASNSMQAPKRYLAYTAAFSRLATIKQVGEFLCIRLKLKPETIRLWHQNNEIPYLLEDESLTLEELEFSDSDQILLELRNKDLTWPEEIRAISQNQNLVHDRRATIASVQSIHAPGACGLHNLGNTCFMNAALQVLFNTKPLTEYFKQNIHLFELNTHNKMSTKGHLTIRYAELLKEILGSQTRSIAPIKFRFVVSKYAPQFTNGMQHDSQELLDWLLDTLHEDLNRVTEKPYIEIKDSNGRCDQLVAMEAYEAFLKRNNSIIVDLFYGQMKSKVTCETCSMESVRFEPFSLLSLPLPVENYIMCEVLIIKLDGSCPVKYGARLNSECKYWDLKNHLSALCKIEPASILICQIENSQIKCVFSNEQKLSTTSSLTLYGYELPQKSESTATIAEAGVIEQGLKDIQRNKDITESAVSNGVTSKKTQSDNQSVKHSLDMMGTSPMSSFMPTTIDTFNMDTFQTTNDYASKTTTLTKDPSKMNGYTNNNDNPSNTNNNNTSDYDDDNISMSSARDSWRMKSYRNQHDYLIAIHRKFTRQDTYFLSYHKSKPSLFGVPLLIPLHDGIENKDLYCNVWQQISRLLSPLPVATRDQANHAEDCDDSMGYDFPFILSVVKECGLVCALCPWEKFCRGCNIPCNDKQFLQEVYPSDNDSDFSTINNLNNIIRTNSIFLCIDWDTSALHLRYQSTREKQFHEHESVVKCRMLVTEPVDLNHCLRAFTSEEKLDEHIHCSHCKSKQPATKKLQLWKLPPILIIHLKRFNFVNNKWVKSQKVVNFPFDNFDPTHFLASVPQETYLRHKELLELKAKNIKNVDCNDEITEFDLENDISTSEKANGVANSSKNYTHQHQQNDSRKVENHFTNDSINSTRRKRLVSTSLTKTPVVDNELVDYNNHKLTSSSDPFDLKYKLYAVVSHSGSMLTGGHYIAYASHANSKSWFCYNDSSCREIPSSQPNIDPSSAYLLFYERKNLDYLPYLPKIENKQPMLHQQSELLEESDNDFKKMCLLS